MVQDDSRAEGSRDEATLAHSPEPSTPSSHAGEVTQILTAIDQGDRQAADQLLPLVYDELRRMAAAKMAQENPGQTLQATALVHEAYLRLVQPSAAQQWDSRRHFFAAAAESMRRILVERARYKRTLKAGGERRRVDLSQVEPSAARRGPDILALHEALERFERRDSRAAQLVKLRFFVGMTLQESAEALAISLATAKTEWAYAKTWLQAELCDDPEAAGQ
jgi:RNA polymerase sigma factor (TIGR02999 family)